MAFADNGMKVQKTADAMHYDKRTISQRLTLIKANTGIDPRNFWGLTRLISIIENEREEARAGVLNRRGRTETVGGDGQSADDD